jgi:hypothetical protein
LVNALWLFCGWRRCVAALLPGLRQGARIVELGLEVPALQAKLERLTRDSNILANFWMLSTLLFAGPAFCSGLAQRLLYGDRRFHQHDQHDHSEGRDV